MFNNAYDVPYHFRNWVGRSTPKKNILTRNQNIKIKIATYVHIHEGKGDWYPPPPKHTFYIPEV